MPGRAAFGLVTVALLLGLLRLVLLDGYDILGQSMYPTLEVGDKALFSDGGDAKRGDIVLIWAPSSAEPFRRLVISRIVGLEGEELEFRDGKVFIDGRELVEPYLAEDAVTEQRGFGADLIVPPDHVFVMGDNRRGSLDSRSYGPLAVGRIEGTRAEPFWWPGFLP